MENIGEKLSYFKFQNSINPFGILFHPKAIETFITKAINKTSYSEKDIFFYNEQWHCFDAHSKLSNPSKETLLHNLNEAIKATNKQIHKSTHIIITLGTAWVYRLLESNQLVANCHKVPQKQFAKELLSVEAITKSLETIVNLIRSVNSKASIIFTVSPVRHIKDGFIENTQSKAHLITGIHSNNQQPTTNNYFPSYEIMMDELRDYRFYVEDMLHPNQTAINYIWEKFQEVWVSSEAIKTMKLVDEVQKGLQHKPFNPDSEAHQKFLLGIKEKQLQLKKEYPHIKF
ncbi:MAG: GSCFA family protein [Flavobacteriaceae bacterium FS1-H7996/R]|nr:MAG: GSCFA family protein [Flavobacteriaceae bacterium FS1-H7996/R]